MVHACRICGSARSRVRARPQPWTFLECTECGVLWVEPMPKASPEDLGAHYTETYYAASDGACDPFAALARDVSGRRLERIEGDLGRRGRLLDVGCGTGLLLAEAAVLGWDAVGVEVSPRAAEAARAHPGVTVHTGTLEDARFDDGGFDAIVASHVLEHVPDPVGFLAELHRILADDGLLVLALPNARGAIHAAANLAHRVRRRYGRDRFACSLYPPSHLYAFDPASLVRALSRARFVPTSIKLSGKGDPDTYPMRTWRGAGRAAFAQRLVESVGRRIGRGSLLEVHARKVSDAR